MCQMLAQNVRVNNRMLSYAIETSPCAKDWSPEIKGKGRSMLQQADECVQLNRYVAAEINGKKGSFSETPVIADSASAHKAVAESAEELAKALDGADDSVLQRPVEFPFGTFPTAIAVNIAMNNATYHWGQVNYIELLDGNTEFRIPPEFAAR